MLTKRKHMNNKKDIQIFMIQRGLSNRQIAQYIGVSEQAISSFIAGKMKSQKIRDFFNTIGCPEPVFCKGYVANA